MKRIFDVSLSAFGLLLFLPLGLIIAAIVKVSDGGPVFYVQTRVGRYGRPFRIWKFRTMIVNADRKGLSVTSGRDLRITPVGRILRKTKLDELPQLWNVLKGEMSFVGPRPEVPRYVELYTAEQREILALRPGITDLATIAFRNEEELLRGAVDVEAFYVQHCLPRKIELNLAYARRANVVRDLWLLVQTVCPYWIGVLGLYAVTLSGSWVATHLLLSDFREPEGGWRGVARLAPWLILPQLICLFWQRQARGLLSYFGLQEVRRTTLALLVAFAIQAPLLGFALGGQPPRLSLFLMHTVMSLFGICGVRLLLRSLRESSTRSEPDTVTAGWVRIGVVGLTPTGSGFALAINRDRQDRRRVVAFFDDDPRTWHKVAHEVPVFGMPECLLNPEWSRRLDEVVIALSEEGRERARELRALLGETALRVRQVSPEEEDGRGAAPVGRGLSGAGVSVGKGS